MKPRFKLQNYSDGAIYRNQDGTYTVETSLGSSNGNTVEIAISRLVKRTRAKKSADKKLDVK